VNTLTAKPGPSRREFIALLAFTMALISLSIDNLLPAFVPIRQAFGVANANDLQLIVTVYMLGSGAMQIVYGSLSDAVGRRPALLTGLVVYTVGSAIGLFASSYAMLLGGRLVQGMGAAAVQVLAMAIIRDRHSGREMAQVLSLVFMVFILVPVVAPAIGSLLIGLAGWRAVFASMLVMAAAVAAWFALRMPETLHREHRRAFRAADVMAAIRVTLAQRTSVGYGLAVTLMMGSLMTYVSSSQQIFETEVYGLGAKFPLAFGGIAASMFVAFFVNSRLAGRHGLRRLSHVCLLLFAATSVVVFLVAANAGGHPPLAVFVGSLVALQFLMCLTMPNFNALAMEPLGAVAGTAASVLGLVTTLGGTAIGMLAGRGFDGTVLPLATTYLACGLLALAAVTWGERGRLVVAPAPG
jgi:MFS transporter, DHA1 family, multidrug resistance protein